MTHVAITIVEIDSNAAVSTTSARGRRRRLRT